MVAWCRNLISKAPRSINNALGQDVMELHIRDNIHHALIEDVYSFPYTADNIILAVS